MEIEQHIWGMTPEGEAVILYILRNTSGAEVRLSTYGATVVSVKMPDRTGHIDDVVLGYKQFDDYFGDPISCGKSLGRCAGRIPYGRMEIEGRECRMEINNGSSHLHGGTKGFGNRLWEGRVETNRIVMELLSDDGEQGYPGELHIEAIFDFDNNNVFEITYLARTEQTTVVNLASNLYFNLSGGRSNNVLDHELLLHSKRYIDTDRQQIATGKIIGTEGTPLDFENFRLLSSGIESDACLLRDFGGYDHVYPIDNWQPNILTEAAKLRDQHSGRCLSISTSQPCIGLSTANDLSRGCPQTKYGGHYTDHAGIALTCQNYFGAPNESGIAPPLLHPGELYCQKTVYCFDTYK